MKTTQAENERKTAEANQTRVADEKRIQELKTKQTEESRKKKEADAKIAAENLKRAEEERQREQAANEREARMADVATRLDEICRLLNDENTGKTRGLINELLNRPFVKDMERVKAAVSFFNTLVAAQTGDADAQFELAEMYSGGAGFVLKSEKKRKYWSFHLKKRYRDVLALAAAAAKNKQKERACRFLSYIADDAKTKYLAYLLSKGVDDSKGQNYLEDAADGGYLPAQMTLAHQWHKKGDEKFEGYTYHYYSNAYKYYRMAAEDNNEGDAYYWMAVMCGNKKPKYGQPYDRKKALRFMQKAAEKGTSYSNVEDWLYVLGDGGSAKILEIARWKEMQGADLIDLGFDEVFDIKNTQ